MKQVQVLFYDQYFSDDVSIFDVYLEAFPHFQKDQLITLKTKVLDKTKWEVAELDQLYKIVNIEYNFEKTYTSSSIVEVTQNQMMFVTVEKANREHEWR